MIKIKKYKTYKKNYKLIQLNNEYKQLAKEIGDMENEVIRTPFENGLFPGKI